MSVKVGLVEDDAGVRETLASVLGHFPFISSLTTYASAEAALRDVPTHLPDVLLVDINLPRMNGIDLIATLKARFSGIQMLVLTTYEETELIFNSLKAGASGYLLKRALPAELASAIEQVHLGGAPMSPDIARKVVESFFEKGRSTSEVMKLSPREHEVLKNLSHGYIAKEIAERMQLSTETVRSYLRSIYEKLHVRSKTEAVLKYLGRSSTGG
jgi:DNA-binding NarL/FixJ family response regulator